MGDFNLEGGINLSSDYYNRSLLNTLQNSVTESNLTQVVDFNTWSRTINGQKKESMLDHAYPTNIENLNAVYFDTPIFGDHVLVILNLAIQMKQKSKTCALKCCWRDYSPANLMFILKPLIETTFYMPILCTVQAYWNLIENTLICATDLVAPLMSNQTSMGMDTNSIPPRIKTLFKKRNRLLKLNICVWE